MTTRAIRLIPSIPILACALTLTFLLAANSPAAQVPSCGDGIIGTTPGETCDPPNQPGGANGNICRANCTVCGDGNMDAGEVCDDGNQADNDACANDCTIPGICGDGIIGNAPVETCDPPGSPAGVHNNTCRGDCTVCGDGVVNDGETCDDGNGVDTDGCRNNCTVCGDGIIQTGEMCDDYNQNDNDSCSNNCTEGCGNGIINTGEFCDDGNTNNTDTCANDCTIVQVAACGDGIVGTSPGETCDPPRWPAGNNACRADCTFCGDGVLDAGEDCDDGNQTSGDGCPASCIPEPVTIYVDCSRPVGGDGSPGSPMNSLRDAVDFAPAGAEIHLLGGTCPVEYLSLYRSVSFVGEPTLPRTLIAQTTFLWINTSEPVSFNHVTLDPNATIGFNFNYPEPPGNLTLIDVARVTVGANYSYTATVRDSVDVSLFGGGPGQGATVDVADSQGIVFGVRTSGGTVQFTARRSSISGFSLSDHLDFNITIEDCLFDAGSFDVHMGGGNAPYGPLRVFIARSTFRNSLSSIVFNNGGEHGGLDAPIDIRLEGNKFENSPLDITIAQLGPNLASGDRQVTIQNNVFENSGVNVNLERSEASGDPPVGIHAANNTIVGAPFGIQLEASSFESTDQRANVHLTNNIIVGGGTGVSVSSPSSAGDILNVQVNHNDLFGNTVADYVFNVPGQVVFDGNIAEDPLFADPSVGDFRLTHASPCIDSGANGVNVPPTDYAGNVRPLDGDGDGLALPDMGAFEFVLLDEDGDGFPVGDDCNDHDASVHPGAPDLPGNAADEDCSGEAVCAPGASWRNHGDFVRCVTHECNSLVGAHQVSRMQCNALISQATQSNVGKAKLARRTRPPEDH